MADPAARIEQALARLTAVRTGQMLGTWRVIRPGAYEQTPTLDADGNLTAADDAPYYEGPGTMSDPTTGRGPLSVTVESESGVPHARILKLPLHSPGLRPGDLATCLADPLSPGLVGDVFEVIGEDERSYATYRRYRVRGSSWSPPQPG